MTPEQEDNLKTLSRLVDEGVMTEAQAEMEFDAMMGTPQAPQAQAFGSGPAGVMDQLDNQNFAQMQAPPTQQAPQQPMQPQEEVDQFAQDLREKVLMGQLDPKTAEMSLKKFRYGAVPQVQPGFGGAFSQTGVDVPRGVDPQAFYGDEQKVKTTLRESIEEMFSGKLRSTPEIEAMPDWMTMPEFDMGIIGEGGGLRGGWAALNTQTTGPKETAEIMKAQFPSLDYRQDKNGNYIMKSSINGKEYAIKPGFRWSDAVRFATRAGLEMGAGRLVGKAAPALAGKTSAMAETGKGFLTETVGQTGEVLAGGGYNFGETLLAGGGQGAMKMAGQGAKAITRGRDYTDIMKRAYDGDAKAIELTKQMAEADPSMANQVAEELQLSLDPKLGVRDRNLSDIVNLFVRGKATKNDVKRVLRKNPEAIKTFEDLGVRDVVGARQLIDVNDFETKKLFDSAQASSKAMEKVESEGLQAIEEKIIDNLDKLRGSLDVGEVSDKVKDLFKTRSGRLTDVENGAYDAVGKYVTPDSKAVTDNTMGYLEGLIESRQGAKRIPSGYIQIEGKKGGYLSPLENRIYQSLRDKVAVPEPKNMRVIVGSKVKSKKGFNTNLVTGESLRPADFVGKAEYQNVDSARKMVGQSMKSASGDSLGNSKQLYKMLTKDQDATIGAVSKAKGLSKEAQAKWGQAKRTHKMGLAVDEDFKKLFSSKLSDFIESEGIISGKDLAEPLERATRKAGKAKPSDMMTLARSIPGGARREVVSSGIMDQMQKIDKMNYKGFADFWSGVQGSKKLNAFLRDPSNLDPMDFALMENIGKTSQAIKESIGLSEGSAYIDDVVNSKSQLLDTLKELPIVGSMTMLTLGGADAVSKMLSSKGGQQSVALNIVMLGAMSNAYRSLTGGHAKKLIEALNSEDMMRFLRNPNVTDASIKELAGSTPMKSYFRRMQMPTDNNSIEKFLIQSMRAKGRADKKD